MNAFKVLERFLFLPELKLVKVNTRPINHTEYHLIKESEFEVCPKCATPSYAAYDHRVIKVRDEPIRNKNTLLIIKKRRFWCKKCYKPFTEPIRGISKRGKMTERFKLSIYNHCREYSNLKAVQKKCDAPVGPYISPSTQS